MSDEGTLPGGFSQTYDVPEIDVKMLMSWLQMMGATVVTQQPTVSPNLPPYQANPSDDRKIIYIPPTLSDTGSNEATRDTATKSKNADLRCEPKNERTWRDDTFKPDTRQVDITSSVTHSIESILHEFRNHLGPEDKNELLHESSSIGKAKKLLTIADTSDHNVAFIQAFRAALRKQSNILYILKDN